MKRFASFLALAFAAVCLCEVTTNEVSARPEYKARVEEITKSAKCADMIKEAKCNVCHYGKSKKNRNEFGQALNKHINDTTYKSLKTDKPALIKKIDEALKAAMKDKSKVGKAFGELMDAGSLPAVNPEE